MEAHELVQDLKKKVLAGEEVTAADYAKIVDGLRIARSAGASKPKAKKASSKEPAKQVDLLSAIIPPSAG